MGSSEIETNVPGVAPVVGNLREAPFALARLELAFGYVPSTVPTAKHTIGHVSHGECAIGAQDELMGGDFVVASLFHVIEAIGSRFPNPDEVAQ